MCVLFFTHLLERAPLRIVQYGLDDMAGPLSGATALVIIRGLFEFGNLAECALRVGVPVYYFLDDNFMLIREEGGDYGRAYERYTNDQVRQTLSGYEEVWLAAPSLIDYFSTHRLHPRLVHYPPVTGPVLAEAGDDGKRPLTIAFFGGLHRRSPFVDFVYPAIRRLAASRPIRLVAAGIERSLLPDDPAVEIICPTYDTSYTDALRIVGGYGVDILVHPSNETANNIYKNPHVIINARAIGAAAIFSHEAPYAALADSGVALLCENTVDGWFAALSDLTSEERRRVVRTAADQYCRTHFGGDANVAIIKTVFDTHPSPGVAARLTRLIAGGSCIGAGHIATRVHGRIGHLTPKT